MPELPEVESTAAFLRERILGKTISAIDVLWARTISKQKPGVFSKAICGAKVTAVGRRGKFVRISLRSADKSDWILYAHLRMSGSFDVVDTSRPHEKHDRVIISLKGGKDIRFHDPRKFGRFRLLRDPAEIEEKLGIEPLSDEFTPELFQSLLAKKGGAIKPTLLNQRIVAGLGNIYVDEALWKANIHPLRVAKNITFPELEKLHAAIRIILQNAIASAGTDFGDGVVYGGGYTPVVYGRDGEPCAKCDTKIVRLVVGQRGTHVCPNCQPSTGQ